MKTGIRGSNSNNIVYANIISQLTLKDTHIPYRSPKQVEIALKKGEYLLSVNNLQLLGWIEVASIWQNWVSITSFYVLPKFRKQGIGTKLLEEIKKENKNKIIFAATFNPWVSKKLLELNFKKTYFLKLPIQFLCNYFCKRFLNKELLVNIRELKYSWQRFILR